MNDEWTRRDRHGPRRQRGIPALVGVLLLAGMNSAAALDGDDATATSTPVAAREGDDAIAPSTLSSMLEAEDPTAYVVELDRLLFEDLVADVPPPARPEAPYWKLDLLQRSLAPSSVLMVFHPDGEVVWAAAIASDGVIRRRLNAPHTSALGPRLSAWTKDPSDRTLDRHAASAIHQNLFLPFQAEVAGKRHVIVAASGVLRDVPFEVLLMAPAQEEAPVAEMAFLVRRFEFAYEPTVGSRLGWSGRPGELRRVRREAVSESSARVVVAGTLMAVAGRAPHGSGVEALGWLREGAAGCLLGGTEEALDGFLRRYYRERAGGRRSTVRAVHRTRIGLAAEGQPPEVWALPMLFGAD